MEWMLSFIVLIAIIVGFYEYRNIRIPVHDSAPVSNQFHSVTIFAPVNCCNAVKALASRKFAAKEAPRLPLDNCTTSTCQCKYELSESRQQELPRVALANSKSYKEPRHAHSTRRKLRYS